MRRFIVLLLITGTVWAQTGLDKLVLDDRTEFLGEYSGVMENLVYFKPAKALAFQGVPINRIRSLQLGDGKTIIQDEYIKIRTILDYKHLSIKDKAIYDAKKDAKKWLFFPPTAVLTLAASSGSYFVATGHNPAESFSAAIIPVLGLFGSYSFFNQKTDEKYIENMSSDELSIYQSTYLREYVKRKNKNVLKSCLALGIAGALGTYIFFKNFSLGPNAFGPSSNAGFK